MPSDPVRRCFRHGFRLPQQLLASRLLLGLVAFGLGSCSLWSYVSPPPVSATLRLSNTRWERITLEVVLTNGADCDDRGPDYVGTQHYELRKNRSVQIKAPHAETVCWRHDRDPANPSPGEWSGWAKATLSPGDSAESEV